MRIRNQKGQSLIEYLILVAIMGVATIGIVRVLGQSVSARFANITLAIQGKPQKGIRTEEVQEQHYKRKDLSDFFNGATSNDKSE